MGKREDKGGQRERGGGLKRKKSKEKHGIGLKLSKTDLLFDPFFGSVQNGILAFCFLHTVHRGLC